MTNLTNVSIYNLKDEVVLSNGQGSLEQEKTDVSFNSKLSVSGGEGVNPLKVGESYYAIGFKEDKLPTRSETVQCTATGNQYTFEGKVAFPQKPQGYSQNVVRAAASEADMLIKFTNYSTTQFNIGVHGANLQYGFGGLTNSPGPILKANSGVQSIGASQILSTLDEGPADVYLEWVNGIRFGVWIHFNFQMFGLGPRPIWYTTTNGKPWVASGSDPSTPFTWNQSFLNGLKIVGTPTSGHSSLVVDVTITN